MGFIAMRSAAGCLANRGGAGLAGILVLGLALYAMTLDPAGADGSGRPGLEPGARPPAPPWTSKFERDHPLSGRIWRPSSGRFIAPSALIAALANADFVLLGEKHDNADHHRLQAWIVRALVGRGRRLAVAFEMFAADQAPLIAAHLASNPKVAAGIGRAVNWSKSGWPDWSLYEPMAQAALDSGLPVTAANLSRRLVEKIGKGGLEALAPAFVARLGLERALEPAIEAAMAREIFDAHCGVLPRDKVGPFVEIQRARDAHMARMIADASAAGLDGAVLITGAGHARRDRGVPLHMVRMAPGKRVAALALIEVVSEKAAAPLYAESYGADTLPFDFVWFTARHELTDPCEKFFKELQKLKKKS